MPPESRFIFVFILFLGCIQAAGGRSRAGRNGAVDGMMSLVTHFKAMSLKEFADLVDERTLRAAAGAILDGNSPATPLSDRRAKKAAVSDDQTSNPSWWIEVPPNEAIIMASAKKKRLRDEQTSAGGGESSRFYRSAKGGD